MIGEDPNLRKQVQNCAAHGMVGYILNQKQVRSANLFLVCAQHGR